MEQPHVTPAPGEGLEDNSHSPKDDRAAARKGSPKSASARFRSFIGRDKVDAPTTGGSAISGTTVSSSSSANLSPDNGRRPHSISSPNLLSLLTVRDNRPVLPSRSPQLARKDSNLPGQENPPGNSTRITPAKNLKNVPIYMYLDDECFIGVPEPEIEPPPKAPTPEPPLTTSFSPVVPSPISPITTPDASPRSSPKPTRPSPLPPRRRSEVSETDIPVIVTGSSPVKPADDNKPDEAMLRSILASPLIGTPSPAFSDSAEIEMPFASPTVLRRPPPRVLASGGGSTTLDKAGKDLLDLPDSTFTSESSNLLKLFLARNHLKSLPDSISHLTDLTYMDLSYNRFEQLPPIEHMVKLKELYLQGNFLLQTDTGLSGLSSLVDLKKLDLSSNQIGNPSPAIPADVYYLTNLHDLHLPHNGISSLSSDISWLTNLTAVDLSHNALVELPPEIGSLQNLKKLKLKHNKLTTLPDELANLANLLDLDVAHNELTQLPPALAALYNLMTLHLSYNALTDIPAELFGGGAPIEGEDGQMWVQGMFALKELRARENQLTTISESISNLVELQLLDLTYNKIEEMPFASLVQITKLEQLMLAGNKIQSVPEDICNFAQLDNLNLSDNLIDSLPENLWQLSTLRHLSLSHNLISSIPFPPPDESWRSLEELFAAGNPNLKEIAPFGELSSLREMYLQNCNFPEVPILHSIANLQALEKLDLSNNSISVLGPEFFELEPLSRFAISHNQFESLPLELSNFRRVEYLDLSHNKLPEEPECVRIMRTSVGTEVISTGNPYTLTQAKPDSANGESTIFQISMSDLVGRRPTMEDTFSVCPKLGGVEGREAFAIFDGHAGSIASHFVAKYLDRIINAVISDFPTEHPLKWLERTYAKLTELFRHKINDSKVSGSKHCGTTGLILLVDAENYYIANVGDTRAVLSRGGTAVRLSTDDKPSNPEEELRIRKLGGFVVVGSEISRVNGTLAVSRSIGDFYMHPYVTAEPHLHEFKRESSDKFIVLACDGVWDEISDQHAVDIIESQEDSTRAAFSLRDKAYAYGSDDNISVMLLKIK